MLSAQNKIGNQKRACIRRAHTPYSCGGAAGRLLGFILITAHFTSDRPRDSGKGFLGSDRVGPGEPRSGSNGMTNYQVDRPSGFVALKARSLYQPLLLRQLLRRLILELLPLPRRLVVLPVDHVGVNLLGGPNRCVP